MSEIVEGTGATAVAKDYNFGDTALGRVFAAAMCGYLLFAGRKHLSEEQRAELFRGMKFQDPQRG